MKSELSVSDEWETPQELFDYLCEKYKITPRLDVASTMENRKCQYFIDDEVDALEHEWLVNYFMDKGVLLDGTKVDVWCNPPHSLTEIFVKKAYEQWAKHNINIIMIIPANSMCTNYAEEAILLSAEYHPINRRFCKFLYKGEKKDSSRNGYFVVIWRKVNE